MTERTKILIVDDREENLVSLEMLLGEFCVDVVKASSGEEALRKTMHDEFAMAIMDVQMPGMDGYETLSLMRKRMKTKYLPVIFVSAIHQSELHIIKGIETGAVDFIPKPIIPEILVGKVRVFLELHHQKKKMVGLLKHLEQNNRELEIQKERAEEGTKAKAMFLANMSHEIRTPLSGILSVSKMLGETQLNEKQHELVRIISTSGKNLSNIINDILDFSKIESGQIELEQIQFSLPEIVQSVVSLLQFHANKKGLELKVEIDRKIPESLKGDPLRLNQVITNLVNNALKFTDAGSVTISVQVLEKSKSEVQLLFSVKDTGIGISEKGKTKLFKEFSQTDSSTSRKFGGTGLGLAISSNLVTLMGGEIGVDSVLGDGAEFWFKLKYKFAVSKGTNGFAKEKTEKVDIPASMKILYAEDNLINQKVTDLLLQRMGIKCDIAENGEEAVERHLDKNYDLILMDMQMPVLDGVGATKKIREMELGAKAEKPVYVVAVTANIFATDKKKCLDAGMNDFISKPFNESELMKILSDAVQNL